MKISFVINYHTDWGESVYLCGNIPELGGGDIHKAVEMTLVSPDTWELEIELDHEPGDFDYSFIVKAPERAWKFEWGTPHRFTSGKGIENYAIFDSWHSQPHDKPFFSSAFVDGMLNRPYRDQPLKAVPGTICFRIEAPMVSPDECMAISGEGSALGNWDPAKAVRMNDASFPRWEVNIPMAGVKSPFEYKFLIINKKDGSVVGWENNANRIYGIPETSLKDQVVVEGGSFANPKPNWKGAGTAIPVFSIRSEEDLGIGDFVDIKKLVDWCVKTGQKILQVLPVNDTMMTKTWLDSYPYKSNSTFALHPQYIRLEEVGTLKDEARREYYNNLKKELNALTDIDYERVNNAKQEYLHEIFAETGANTRRTKAYKDFIEKNSYWLKPYA
ncbi:MAG: 4-alpha-glucanotransferase, partial [Muribaculaceae bacterium]|nr:4-alpha-glucanotransferase [Muribaculaceae bacterium]